MPSQQPLSLGKGRWRRDVSKGRMAVNGCELAEASEEQMVLPAESLLLLASGDSCDHAVCLVRIWCLWMDRVYGGNKRWQVEVGGGRWETRHRGTAVIYAGWYPFRPIPSLRWYDKQVDAVFRQQNEVWSTKIYASAYMATDQINHQYEGAIESRKRKKYAGMAVEEWTRLARSGVDSLHEWHVTYCTRLIDPCPSLAKSCAEVTLHVLA
ncbi:hypothetical protein AG1IA_09160 [Rhizoctonia solani AG-1 IA]|uniref:Uncharacterized protein n=1 Tax=Thanatephorus cucumeris (strain AG1-IA) TaxID=983506 RepID=L8WFU4_THACA|nr:hypothetical protein AG1IA_09160 [Rhizoctonia solani AG-1 IA]